MLSVSERLSKFFPEGCLRDLPKKLKRFVSSTQVLRKVLASCTTSVYVNLSKNSLMPFGLDFLHDSENQVNLFSLAALEVLLVPQPRFLSESECKGTTNINTIQIFKQKNSRKTKDFRECLQNMYYTLYYI